MLVHGVRVRGVRGVRVWLMEEDGAYCDLFVFLHSFRSCGTSALITYSRNRTGGRNWAVSELDEKYVVLPRHIMLRDV